MNIPYRIITLAVLYLSFSNGIHAAPTRHVVENQKMKMVVIPRTAQQMAAFYEGREFPANAINATRNACFFTIGIHNKTDTILWLDTPSWELKTTVHPLPLLSRKQWKQRWKALDLEQRFQSTFRWTLLPDQLDFQPNEREGGNITLARTDATFTLTARFATGPHKNGEPVIIKFENLRCAKDSAP